MPKIAYVRKKFQQSTLDVIAQANAIIEEYLADGYTLTVRQLYYQFVSRDLLENTKQNYGRVKSIVSDGRLAGLIDWEAIEDRTRQQVRNSHWTSPRSIIRSAASSYQLDKWEDQPYRVEVWCEKEALSGIFEQVCSELDVPFLACRGYVSQSEMWRAANRLKEWEEEGAKTIVFHFGDHDPSGLDMTRDIKDRLAMFGARTVVERIALNMSQVEEYDPPPNFAKQTDARYATYEEEFGDQSWEIDALEPRVLVELVEMAVYGVRDADLWAECYEREERERKQLKRTALRWREVTELVDQPLVKKKFELKDAPNIFDGMFEDDEEESEEDADEGESEDEDDEDEDE